MNVYLVVVYVIENIFSYVPNLKIEIAVIDNLLTRNLVNRVTVLIPSAVLNTIYENITDIEWRPSRKITKV